MLEKITLKDFTKGMGSVLKDELKKEAICCVIGTVATGLFCVGYNAYADHKNSKSVE